MEEPMTEELLDELLDAPDPSGYLHAHDLRQRNLASYLQQLASERGMERRHVVREAQLDQTYGYQLFTGARSNPSRDKVLQLAFALHLSPRETDRLLQAAGASRLYCKVRRDAIVVFCLDRGQTLLQANKALYEHGEKILGDD